MYNEALHQRVRVCKALLAWMDYDGLWTSEGPTARAKEYVDQYGGPMSNPQWILYQFVWYVWGRPSDVKVQELMALPAPYNQLAADLLLAMATGPEAIEAWLVRLQTTQGSAKSRIAHLFKLS